MGNYWLNQDLEMWTNDFDYIIAHSKEEAIELAKKIVGYGDDDLAECEWLAMDPDKDFYYEHADGSRETRTVAEWIEWSGKGYFACSDF